MKMFLELVIIKHLKGKIVKAQRQVLGEYIFCHLKDEKGIEHILFQTHPTGRKEDGFFQAEELIGRNVEVVDGKIVKIE